MKKVQITKNEKVIKTIMVPKLRTVQQVFNYAVDLAGGMWNGKDVFKVIIVE